MEYNELKEAMKETKPKMTASERMAKYFAGEEVDHIPYGLLADPLNLCDIYGYTTSQINADFELFTEVVVKAINDNYIDGVRIGLGLRTLGAAMGSTLHYPKHGIDNIEKYILQSYDDWDKMIDPDPYNNEILTPMLEQAAKLKERFPKLKITTGVCGPVSTAIALRPIEKTLRDTRKNPEKIKELTALCVENSLRWVKAFKNEIGPATASISDPVTCTDILSQKQFKEFSLPGLKHLASGLKEILCSVPSMHICGHTKGLWPYLQEIGISSFSVDNCEDLAELREEIGNQITIVGNVPPVDVLRNGTINDVIESVKSCISKGATSPKGYIISSGCGLPIGTPKENLDAYLYAIRKYGQGAKIGEMPKGMKKE